MNAAQEQTKSLWTDTPVADAAPLSGDQSADVAIIGAGIAGLSTAYELTARGRSVIVIDRGEIGSGMTARTTAHLASALDDFYSELIKARGIEVAKLVYQSQAAAISRFRHRKRLPRSSMMSLPHVDRPACRCTMCANPHHCMRATACARCAFPIRHAFIRSNISPDWRARS